MVITIQRTVDGVSEIPRLGAGVGGGGGTFASALATLKMLMMTWDIMSGSCWFTFMATVFTAS